MAVVAAPAWATEVAPPAPIETGGPEARLAALLFSPEAQALKASLDRLGTPGKAGEKTLLQGVRAFYAARRYQPAWIGQDGRPDQRMSALRQKLDRAADDGLDPASFATADAGRMDPADLVARGAADVAFSRAVSRFVTQRTSGQLAPRDVSPMITIEPSRLDVADALNQLSETASVALALERYEPPHPEYLALKAKLAELRTSAKHEAEPIGEGVSLRPGGADPRVPLLRARLGTDLEPGANPDLYDASLAEAVKSFQETSGLTGDGILGPRTLVALNGPKRGDEIAAVLANMERWRWMPRNLGATHVIVNVPEFMVRIVQDGAVAHATRVVVGKPTNPTPTFSNAMTHIVVNPYWNVPTSIVTNEMMSGIEQDPAGYFAKHGYQVLAKSGGKMRIVDPASLDWSSINPHSVRIRQVPGDDNALGRVKFMFPNQHAVYLHDTPSKSLFRKDYRAFSHGCVRVDNPLEFADAIFSIAAPKWNATRLQKLFGGPERRINLDTPVPVHLTYFTASVDPSGRLVRFPDIYGYDAAMLPMLNPADRVAALMSP